MLSISFNLLFCLCTVNVVVGCRLVTFKNIFILYQMRAVSTTLIPIAGVFTTVYFAER